MADDSVNDLLIQRLKQFAVKPSENVEGMRAVVAKLHSRASSQDKNVRTRTLERLWNKQTGIVALLVSLLENVRDHVTACSLAGILHDCVSPKCGKQRNSPAICQLIGMNATQNFVKLIKPQNQEGGHLSDAMLQEIIWILAQLAVKDPKFATKARLLNAVKTFHNLLRVHCSNIRLVYPILLLIKVLSRNFSAATILVKDGIVSTMEKTVIVIGFSPNPKLKLALNILNHLTKIKLCVIRITKSGLIHLFLRIFERWERFEGKLRHCICNYTLICLQHMCATKMGRKAIRTHNGMNLLYKFCITCPEEKIFDNLLSRVCGIINLCLERKQLPLEASMSPAVFPLPAVRDYSSIDLLRGASSSRETSPGSDEDEDEDPEDEDDDVTVLQEKDSGENRSLFTSVNMNVREIEDLKEYNIFFTEFFGSGVFFDMHKHYSDTIESIVKNTFYEESSSSTAILHTKSISEVSHSSPSSTITKLMQSISDRADRKVDGKSSNSLLLESTNSEPGIKGMTVLSDIYAQTGYKNAHCTIASRVNSVLPFVKVAYPDMMGGDGVGLLEPLNIKDRKVCREKLLTCVDRGLHPSQMMYKIVYNLDALIAHSLGSKSTQEIPKKILFNLDEIHLGQRDVTKNHLLFESRFESGNLRKAIQIAPREYDLILTPDVNSARHLQWFYFEVSNMDADVAYVFNIINCEKQNSQFNYGMKPIMYSVQNAVKGRHGWVRIGTDICYYRNSYQNPNVSGKARSFLTTTFTVTFENANDVCYFAYHYPYTYTQLMTQIWKWANLLDPTQIYFRAESLCLSLNNNEAPLLTITAPETESNKMISRETVFLTSRVHPGESNASWVMHGTLNHLLSDLTSAYKLRQRYIFKVVPMLNMEGVINGCHRCGLTDEDLNRRWSRPNPVLHPVIYHTKGLIDYCVRVLRKPPFVFCDYHGHSRRKNVFLYGCSNVGSWNNNDRSLQESHSDYLMLPHLMEQFSPSFSLSSCCYKVERQREATARVTVWREFGIKRSYTMESSYCGCDQGLYNGNHLDTLHLKEIGATFCEAMYAINDESSWRLNLTTSDPEVKQVKSPKKAKRGRKKDDYDVDYDADSDEVFISDSDDDDVEGLFHS